MALVSRQTVVSLWHYHCPQCGIGSAETGSFAVRDAIYCEVCIEDGQPVRLIRWPVEEGAATPGGVRRRDREA